jgi:hypothetical protein
VQALAVDALCPVGAKVVVGKPSWAVMLLIKDSFFARSVFSIDTKKNLLGDGLYVTNTADADARADALAADT